jgi:hypothetical protein
MLFSDCRKLAIGRLDEILTSIDYISRDKECVAMGKIDPKESGTDVTITIDANTPALILEDQENKERVRLGRVVQRSPAPALSFWGLRVKNAQGDDELWLGRRQGGVLQPATETVEVSVGGGGGTEGASGEISVKEKSGKTTARIDGGRASLTLGDGGQTGDIVLRDAGGDEVANLSGARMVLSASGKKRITIAGPEGILWLGGQGANGSVVLFDAAEQVNNTANNATIWLSGQSGDIVLRNADCAEEFDVAHVPGAEPGAVMVIGADDALELGREAYDKRVVGVVSGAGHLRPGIVLGRQPSCRHRLPIALTGKVFCKVDARYAPIAVGDLLTTSATPGHAMKAVDQNRAFGAVIGKALRAQAADTGLIPVLIALQ